MISPGPTHRSVRLLVGLACGGIVAFYFWTVRPVVSALGNTDAAGAYYNRLADGFSAGQLNLAVAVPPGLARLPDPYDPVANQPFRKFDFEPNRLHDTSYYRGKIYLYFSPVPALVLFWPFHAVTGRYLWHSQAVAFFCAIGFLASAALLRRIWRQYFPSVGVLAFGSCLLALGLANSIPVLLARPDVWEVPISCAYAFVMLALGALYQSLHATRGARLWLGAASLCYALAIATRPALLWGAACLAIPVLVARNGAATEQPRADGRWSRAVAALIPLALVGAGVAAYNFARFGSALEFGQTYQLAADRQNLGGHFGWGHFWYNLRLYFLSLTNWDWQFPFVQDVDIPPRPAGHAGVEAPYGILVNTPVSLFGLALLWTRASSVPAALRWFQVATVVFFGAAAVTLSLYFWTCARYQADFHPALVVLACIGFLHLGANAATRTAWKRIAWAGLWAAALFVSTGYDILRSVHATDQSMIARGRAFDEAGRVVEAVDQYEQALRLNPASPVARHLLGADLENLGRRAEAIKYYEEALRIRPDSAVAQNNLGNALRESGRPAEALPHFQAALRRDAKSAQVHLNLALALMDLGRREEAATAARQAVTLDPNLAEAHYVLGAALWFLGQKDEGLSQYREARRLKPSLPEVRF